jgi:hypothetical protein
MEKFTEVRPRDTIKLLEGLNPTSSSALKVHAGDFDPPARRYIIHLKVIFSLGNP